MAGTLASKSGKLLRSGPGKLSTSCKEINCARLNCLTNFADHYYVTISGFTGNEPESVPPYGCALDVYNTTVYMTRYPSVLCFWSGYAPGAPSYIVDIRCYNAGRPYNTIWTVVLDYDGVLWPWYANSWGRFVFRSDTLTEAISPADVSTYFPFYYEVYGDGCVDAGYDFANNVTVSVSDV